MSLGTKMPFSEGFVESDTTEANTGQVNEEHEGSQIKRYCKKSERPIQDLFKGTMDTGEPIRVILTKGVAGIGKSTVTQKFSLDWAEGKANQDIDLLFHFTFKDLNSLRGTNSSIVNLLHKRFKESAQLFSFQCIKLLFIFDGLDECRLTLDFSRTRVVESPTERAPLEVLLVNLIRGNLYPTAKIWITTRPAAASWIPAEYICKVTEVHGFTSDWQKEHYFNRRMKEQHAAAVISHIKKNRNLHVMCSIPIFCSIVCTVSKKLLEKSDKAELPKTVTEMYVQFRQSVRAELSQRLKRRRR